MMIAQGVPGQQKRKPQQGIGDVLMERATGHQPMIAGPGGVASHGPWSGVPPTARPMPRSGGIVPPGRPNLPPVGRRPAPLPRTPPRTPPGRPNLPPGRGPIGRSGPVVPPGRPNLPPAGPRRPVPPPAGPRRPVPGKPPMKPPVVMKPPVARLPPGGGVISPDGPGNLPPMVDNGGVASHGPGSGAPPQVDPSGGRGFIPPGQGITAPFDPSMGGTGIVPLGPDGQPLPQGEGGGNIEDELLRRFQMQQGMYF